MRYKVNEIFESINGEGLHSGELTTFVRFHGCNLHCRYCDTQYACAGSDFREMQLEELLDETLSYGTDNVTLTGGEPLIQPNVQAFVSALCCAGKQVEIETNGSIDIAAIKALGWRNLHLTLDYKTASSGMEDRNILEDNYAFLDKRDTVKFVVGSEEELETARQVCGTYGLINRTNVILSPVFGSIEPADIVGFVKRNKLNGVRVQLQIHKIIWNPNERGV